MTFGLAYVVALRLNVRFEGRKIHFVKSARSNVTFYCWNTDETVRVRHSNKDIVRFLFLKCFYTPLYVRNKSNIYMMSMITIGSRIPYFNHATRVSHIFTAIERVSTIQFSSHYYWYSFIICRIVVKCTYSII